MKENFSGENLNSGTLKLSKIYFYGCEQTYMTSERKNNMTGVKSTEKELTVAIGKEQKGE